MFLLGFSCVVLASLSVDAAISIRNGRIVDADEVATFPVEEHEGMGLEAIKVCDWHEAARQFRIVTNEFPGTKESARSFFFLGVAYYHLQDFEFSNQAFSDYVMSQSHPEHFEEAMEYKFLIAEAFRNGAKRRILGSRMFPKWLSAENMAIEAYDEIIATMPSHELAAKSLFAKGCFHWKLQDYSDSVENFQKLILRFPKHEMALESYVMVSEIFLDQCHKEHQNVDILAFAEVNLKQFRADFPGEPRLEKAEKNFCHMKEVYARGLFDTGQFYERVGKPQASYLYYQNTIDKFPSTFVADKCRSRLRAMGYQCIDSCEVNM